MSGDAIREDAFPCIGVEEQSLGYWSGRAEEYSALHMASYESGKREVFAREIALSLPDPVAGEEPPQVLDLGCGSGFMSLLLLDAGYAVTGIDFSADMLRQAEKNVSSKGYDASFFRMRAQDLVFLDGTFDAVVSRNVTWTLEQVDKVYEEVFRVLKPGGVFLNLDANYGRMFAEAEARGETPTHVTQTLEQLRTRNDIVRNLPISHVDRPAWDVEFFRKLGAADVQVRPVGEGTNVPGSAMFALTVRR